MTTKNSLQPVFLLCKRNIIVILILIFHAITVCSQGKNLAALPQAYSSLKNDNERIQFIIKTINDSLMGDNLVHVYDWARTGLTLAEKKSVDSLKGSFYMYMGKAYYYYYEKTDSAILFYKKAIPFFTNPQNNDYAISVRSIMDCYGELGEKDSCFKYLDESLSIMNLLPDTSNTKLRLAEVIGSNYGWFGMYKSAIRLYDLAKNGYLKKKNMQGVGMVLSHTALIHDELEETEEAISYWKQSLPFLKNFKRPYATNCSNIGAGYYNLSQHDSAIYYLKESNTIAEQIRMNNLLALNKKINAEVLTAKNLFPEARKLLNECLSFFRENQDPRNTILTLFAMSNLDSATGNIQAATQDLNEGVEISRKSGFSSMELKALRALSFLSARKGNYKPAWQQLQSAGEIFDSLTKEKTKTDLADFEILYKTQEKEQQIELLKKDNQIKELQLQSNRRDTFFYVLVLALVIVILLVSFYQRNLRHKIMVQKTKAELQTQVLRSQMNPHFIFNSLNSIENFVMQNEKRNASDYLNKFSKLIRSILDSSRNELVPVAKDVESLQLYVELEQLRFNNRFSYNTYVDPELIEGDYQVPSLLIQPYVENSIIHGLAHSDKTDLNLIVKAELDKGYIKYTMQDNGIGRKKAEEYNQYNKPYHKSVGLKITEDRISIFNEAHGVPGMRPVITDLWDEEGHPAGTRVEIKIKAA